MRLKKDIVIRLDGFIEQNSRSFNPFGFVDYHSYPTVSPMSSETRRAFRRHITPHHAISARSDFSVSDRTHERLLYHLVRGVHAPCSEARVARKSIQSGALFLSSGIPPLATYNSPWRHPPAILSQLPVMAIDPSKCVHLRAQQY